MTAPRWHDWDRRLIGWFLSALVVLVMLLGDPRGADGDGPDQADDRVPAGALCLAIDDMSAARDRLVEGDPSVTVADLRQTATTARSTGVRTEGLDRSAYDGLRFFTGLFLALPDDPMTQQLLSADGPADIADQAHADAFVAWLKGHCAGARPARPTR